MATEPVERADAVRALHHVAHIGGELLRRLAVFVYASAGRGVDIDDCLVHLLCDVAGGHDGGHDDRAEAASHICGLPEQVKHHFVNLVIVILVKERVKLAVGVPDGLVETGCEQPVLVHVTYEAECRVQAEVKGVFMQDARAHAVDGGDPARVDLERLFGHALLTQLVAHACLDLGRCRLGEGDGKHLVDVGDAGYIGVEQGVGDALREHERLARSGAGAYEQGTVHVFDAGTLLGGEGAQVHGYFASLGQLPASGQ